MGYKRLSMSEIMEILLRLKSFGIIEITKEKPKLDKEYATILFDYFVKG